MRMKEYLRLGGLALLSGSLAACGDNGNNNPTPTPTPTPMSFQEKVSPAFAAIFNAAETAYPVDPTDASVPALAPASDPVSD